MLESLKRMGRVGLRRYCASRLRGRSRAYQLFAPLLMPRGGVETVRIGAHSIRLDYRIRAMSYMAYGMYEAAERSHFPDLVPRGGIVCDVGANIGFISAHLAEAVGPQGRVYAFEPSPTCLASLRDVAASSGWETIQVIGSAVAEASRQATYYETELVLSHGFGRIDHRPGSQGHDGQYDRVSDHDVAVVSLDDFCEQQGVERIDLVKIDVEGAERQVVQGMARLIGRGQRPALLTEISKSGDLSEELRAMGQMLAEWDYCSLRLTDRIAPVNLSELPDHCCWNLLWAPRHQLPQFVR